ncbi:MAG: hypothetical protein P4M01_10590 [Acidobacteriota bacterium]|nr:hypothetical protein [Acidobacteriota bacterium]
MPRRDKNHKSPREWAVGVLLAAATAVFVFWQNAHLTVLWDLSYILEIANRLALGQIPYRDFPFPYAPLTFLAQAAIIRLFGHAIWHHALYAALSAAAGTIFTWRIVLRLLRGSHLPQYATALLLTLPLIVLSTGSIFPHPFYDCDGTVFVLFCLWLLLKLDDAAFPAGRTFLVGALLVVPVFIKQNTGLAFAASACFCAAWLALRGQRRAAWLLPGALTGMIAALATLHWTVMLHNYIHWTIAFAASRRLPGLHTMVGVYRDPELILPGLLFAAGAVLWTAARRQASRPLPWIAAALLASPLLLAGAALLLQDNDSDRVEALLRTWPVLLVAALLWSAARAWKRPSMISMLPLMVLGTVHGAFLSQQLWGSTYALWPLFVLLAASLLSWTDVTEERLRALRALSIAFCVVLLACGGYYALSHERLQYVDLDGDTLQHSRLPALRGLAMRGDYLPQFEELVDYTTRTIPRDDAILEIPGEDLFYYTTGRVPRFPVILMDNTVNPYSAEQMLTLCGRRDVRWIIVKKKLQLQEEPLAFRERLMLMVARDYEPVESLANYDIYRRRGE